MFVRNAIENPFTHFSRLHYCSQVPIVQPCTQIYVVGGSQILYSFFRTSGVWNSLPAFYFPAEFDLQQFKCLDNGYLPYSLNSPLLLFSHINNDLIMFLILWYLIPTCVLVDLLCPWGEMIKKKKRSHDVLFSFYSQKGQRIVP